MESKGTGSWPIIKMPTFLRGRLLVQMLLAYMGGLLLGIFLSPPPTLCGWMTLALFTGVALCLRFYLKVAPALLLIGMMALGCFLCARAEAATVSFPVPPGEEVSLTAKTQMESVLLEENRYRALARVLTVEGEPWQGQIYVYYEGGPLLSGSYIASRGKVMSFTPYGNPGAFDYAAYMKRQGIAAAISCYFDGELHSTAGFALVRGSARARLLAAFNEAGENAALLKGIFLGDKSDLTLAQMDALTYSGVLHAFTVSGLHVAYMVGAALLIAGPGWKRRWYRLGLAVLMLAFYLNLTGAPAPIVRACVTALAMLFASAFNEKSDPYTSLALAALLCLIYRPLWLMDAGFQLSFAAAFGLLYLLPLMRRLTGRGPLGDACAVTLAASFITMPLVSYYFCHISLVSFIVSPLFVAGTGMVVICCFAAALAAVLSTALAAAPLFAMDIVVGWLYRVSAWATSLPGAYIASGPPPLFIVAIFYALLLALPVLIGKCRRPRLFLSGALFLLMLMLVLAPVLKRSEPGQLEVVFLDVGQGDAALLLTPGGHSILVDGGGNRMSEGSVGEHVLLPYLRYRGLKRVDVIISSHPDTDHIDGLLTVLKTMPVGQLLYADCFPESELQQRMLVLARENGAKLIPAYAGQSFAVEPGLTLDILHPTAGAAYNEEKSNDGSLTALFSHGQVKFLFTGDAHLEQIENLPAAQIVKLPHHGSKYNFDEDVSASLQAQAVVLSVGRDNSYGHPAPVVIEYWQDKATLYRTDRQGAVTVFSDGRAWRGDTYWRIMP